MNRNDELDLIIDRHIENMTDAARVAYITSDIHTDVRNDRDTLIYLLNCTDLLAEAAIVKKAYGIEDE
jgi:hypothetical protein